MTVLSVVMSVFNGEKVIEKTLQSISEQTVQPFEIIIINDGSTDNTGQILDGFASVREQCQIVHQKNAGLTQSLIIGCAMAKGQYIARHDAGDVSEADRFENQLWVLGNNQDVTLVSTATRFVDHQGYWLYDVSLNDETAKQGMKAKTAKHIVGPPHHGSTMFRRQDYEAVGGYRPQCYVSQDLDLWLRLIEKGDHRSIADVKYVAVAAADAISFRRAEQQNQVTKKLIALRHARINHQDQTELLGEIHHISRQLPTHVHPTTADYYHFIAGCQRQRDPRLARKNYLKALHIHPWRLRTIVRYLLSWVL